MTYGILGAVLAAILLLSLVILGLYIAHRRRQQLKADAEARAAVPPEPQPKDLGNQLNKFVYH